MSRPKTVPVAELDQAVDYLVAILTNKPIPRAPKSWRVVIKRSSGYFPFTGVGYDHRGNEMKGVADGETIEGCRACAIRRGFAPEQIVVDVREWSGSCGCGACKDVRRLRRQKYVCDKCGGDFAWSEVAL